jgi:uncharacterized protein (DUF952 family)
MILHLMTAATWAEVAHQSHYWPASADLEGFIHCSGNDETMLAVANRFYVGLDGEVVVLSIDHDMLGSSLRWEPPVPEPEGWDRTTMFPHLYAPLPVDAVRDVRRLHRDALGRFEHYESA